MSHDRSAAAKKMTLKRFLSTIGILIAILAAFPSSSKADHRQRIQRHVHKHMKRLHTTPFVHPAVPRRIFVESRSRYHPYSTGRIYYGPHRHHHSSYRFPVFVNGAVVYRPYTYCGDQVFLSAPIPLPRLAFSLTFGSPVTVIGPDLYPVDATLHYHHDWDDDDD